MLLSIAVIVCVAYSTLIGVEPAATIRPDAHAVMDAFADIRFGYWVIDTLTIALVLLLASRVDWC